MPNTAYPTLTSVEQVFKDIVWSPALTAGETALKAVVPFLGWPVISTITDWVINGLGNWIYSELVLLVDIEAIKLVNAEHQAAYDQASEQLRIVIEDKGVNSADYQKARDAAKLAMAKFTDINVAS